MYRIIKLCSFTSCCFRVLVAVLFCGVFSSAAFAEFWVLIDTRDSSVSIMQDKKAMIKLDDISVGRGGVTNLHVKGDDTTPRGEYRVVRISNTSRFRRFFEINYPTIAHAEQALDENIIDENTYRRIIHSQQRNGFSPSDTALGGHLGIHGIGIGDPQVHESFNWTNGCIALNNTQIDVLYRWIGLGTKVVIK